MSSFPDTTTTSTPYESQQTMPPGDKSSPRSITVERAESMVRQLWMILLSARYGGVSAAEEKEVSALCHQLTQGVPGWEKFNHAAVHLCERVTSLRGGSPFDQMRMEGLLNEADYLRALAAEARRQKFL